MDMLVEITTLDVDDYMELKDSMIEAYGDWATAWTREHIHKLIEIFPQGQLAVKVNEKVVGCALSIIVDYDRIGDDHNFKKITGDYTFSTHNPKGDVLYGIEIFIRSEYRSMRLGRRLYDSRKELCERLNLRSIMAGGRLPNYSKYSNEITPKEYLEKVKTKIIYDPTISFQLANDFHIKKVLKNYLVGDVESKEYAALIEWNNLYYEPMLSSFRSRRSNVRLALIQWQMRHFQDFQVLCDHIEFFIDAAAGYKSDFILFPEYFHAPLMAQYNQLSEVEAIKKLADYTDLIKDKFVEYAIKYNANIITGSMPVVVGERIRNIGFLCRRNGTVEKYEKLHVTPVEEAYWGIEGGDNLQVFDTDCGKIGILICYDVEFPELSRLLANEGMEILFVPFSTDTQSGYTRVRNCAQARAIENECFVAIAGSVGNLPKVSNMDIQYAQSAVFTPSDFAFPTNGIKAEATPNTEMTLIVDVDLDLLKNLHLFGSVRNLTDRRKDIYNLERITPKRLDGN